MESSGKTYRNAGKLFDRVYGQARLAEWLSKLTGKENGLQLASNQVPAARRKVGTVVVPLSKIVGSEGRSTDFDAEFRPLKKHNRERWIGIAAAYLSGVVLPAVELIQAGDAYYVRDGHHRISVAKALGQLEIDARLVN